MPKNEDVYEKKPVTLESLQGLLGNLLKEVKWNTELLELEMFMRIASSNEEAIKEISAKSKHASSLLRLADTKPEEAAKVAGVPKWNKEIADELHGFIAQAREDIALFSHVRKNYLEGMDMLNRKVLRTLERKYPVLSRKPQKEEKTPPIVERKCDLCKEPAILMKDGKASCRVHYADVFKLVAKEGPDKTVEFSNETKEVDRNEVQQGKTNETVHEDKDAERPSTDPGKAS